MDAARKMNRLDSRGSILILVAVSMVVFIAIAGLAIDLAYMYANKTQLQKAADAGALAGAGRINDTGYSNQTGARNSAVHIGDVNFNLNLSSNGTGTGNNAAGGDVVVGHWDPAATPKFSTTALPVNAVKVVARRNSDQGAGIGPTTPFNLFFGGATGHSTMGAEAAAIAWRPPRARFYLLLNNNVCTASMSSAYPFQLTPQGSNSMAWSSLTLATSTNDNLVRGQYLCPTDVPNVDVCGQSVNTLGGVATSDLGAVSLDFYDPNYDVIDKTFDGSGNVATWNIMVPVADPGIDPTVQNSGPVHVWGYALITVTKACPTNGSPCNGINGRTNPEKNANPDPCKSTSDGIYISSISCSSCAADLLKGTLPILAQ